MIAEAAQPEFPEIEEFYRVSGARGRPSPGDRLFVARFEGALVGAVRLCDENGVLVLRTMRVAATHQRRGIGRQLLAALVAEVRSRECFLLGYAHLEGFYGLEGFEKIDPARLPPHLRERHTAYLAEFPDMIPMRRASPAT